jgi:hypothetical protein
VEGRKRSSVHWTAPNLEEFYSDRDYSSWVAGKEGGRVNPTNGKASEARGGYERRRVVEKRRGTTAALQSTRRAEWQKGAPA